MPIATGESLGPYEILSRLGKGGMGEVWRARDPRLGRDVAIKVSAQQFSDRFEREARSIAALNHPNICTLHDVGPNYLVMELVEGPTLAERIAEGPIPVDEALRIAKQIAAALEAAHEKGIIHRDLKPANVKLKPDGSVKVLDFGLAKSSLESTLTADSPTMLSAVGMIVGTAAYMAPEQARGKNVDRRADIWAFGVVLYEMATARRLFEGEDLVETLAAVVHKEPDLSAAPARFRRALERCLVKDPNKRLRDISGIELLLEQPEAAGRLPVRRSKSAWLIAAAAIAAAAALAFIHFRESAPVQQTFRFELSAPAGGSADTFAISPDGRTMAFAARVNGKQQLWLQPLDSLEAHPVPFTEDASFPFWSPDSAYVGFFAAGKLKKVPFAGGPAQTVCEAVDGRGATWGAGNVILFSADGGRSPIRRVPASGGTPNDATSRTDVQDFRHPFFMPDGRHFLYVASSVRGGSVAGSGIFMGSLDGRDDRRILPDESGPVFARSPDPSRPGEILFIRDKTLMAIPFDDRRRQVAGEARAIAEHVGLSIFLSYAPVSASNNGVLVYQSGLNGGTVQLAWFDRKGQIAGTIGERAGDLNPVLSPDGGLLAFGRKTAANDVWIRDLKRGSEVRLTREVGTIYNNPQWSPDGKEIAFFGRENGALGLYREFSNGSGNPELLLAGDGKVPWQWSRDGRFIVYGEGGPLGHADQHGGDLKTGLDVFALPVSGSAGDRQPIAVVRTTANDKQGQISPDGRWIAFASDQSGRFEIYVRSFPSNDDQVTISLAGGQQPRWRADGKEIFFASLDDKIMAVPVKTAASGKAKFEAGIPAPLFDAIMPPGPAFNYDVAADGKRFLIAFTGEIGSHSTPLTVVTNWQAGLRK